MPINTRSELTIDIEQSISKAYDSSLRGREAKDLTVFRALFSIRGLKPPASSRSASAVRMRKLEE